MKLTYDKIDRGMLISALLSHRAFIGENLMKTRRKPKSHAVFQDLADRLDFLLTQLESGNGKD